MTQEHIIQALRQVNLDDKYTLDQGQIFITGMQALVRLPMMQRRLDQQNGLNTAGFISGYRGSPLGGYDLALWKARKHLDQHQIHFKPGINEDLGATAVWGSQQTTLSPQANVQGVFGLWYGKGPGVDRTGDVFRHANAAGTSQYGGVLALSGDDHACKSSTLPHQTEYAFMDAFIPVIHPATVQDILDLGLYGWALSRYSGTWVAFKVISDTVDTAASVLVDPSRLNIRIPEDFVLPPGGLNIRWPDPPLDQEKRLHDYKMQAIPAFVRANQLDKQIFPRNKTTRIGLIAVGKAYLDTRQALYDLGITEEIAAKLGIGLYKVVVSWPLEPQGILSFCEGLEEVIVIEEKRPVLETQVKDILYHLPAHKRPKIVGKTDETGQPLLPSTYELSAFKIAVTLAQRFKELSGFGVFREKFSALINKAITQEQHVSRLKRVPYYCSGCPHNTSTTQLPEGSRALAGIGCHYMATWIDHKTQTFAQMGGEGVPWIGQAPFTKEKHIFANLGDGTYFHSGSLAIRAAVAANVNITYKILYNDAVAMTGGQPVDGQLSVDHITHQLASEGVQRIAVVADDLDRYPLGAHFAAGTTLHHRDQLGAVQEDLKVWPGVSALIYDQTCAAEKRRRRKRGLMEDPNRRIFINESVCEGCGDCGAKSNCLSLTPLETEWGRKRAIDQSSCNKDYSCVKGFCPSFVSVIGGEPRKNNSIASPEDLFSQLPNPIQPTLHQPYGIFITGIGGTGVITLGTLLGAAAYLEEKGCSVVDMAGLAQKGGAVVSHVRISKNPEDIHATRIDYAGADLLLGCDIVVSASQEALEKINPGHTKAVINTHLSVTGHFTQNPDYHFPSQSMEADIIKIVGQDQCDFLNATKLATSLMADSITTNLFMVGYALQKGYIPLSPESLDHAIRLNGISVNQNIQAVKWGRLAAVDMDAVQKFATNTLPVDPDHLISETIDQLINRRQKFLGDYQNQAYADRYTKLLERVRAADGTFKRDDLSKIVAQTYFRLMAYKDEYEVARLYTNGNFEHRLQQQFSGDYKVQFHLAPPLLSKRDPQTGELQKQTYGPWVFKAFKVLAKLKGLRGTVFDIFGYLPERKLERQLIRDFEITVDKILEKLTPQTYDAACQLAELPQKIRGFGHVKEKNYEDFKKKEQELLQKILT